MMEIQQTFVYDLPPEILEQIFYYLRLRDLLNCRLVHWSWKKSATKPCRDKTNEIQFLYQDDHNRVLLRDFMSLLNNSTDLQTFPTGTIKVGICPQQQCKSRSKSKKLSADEITRFFNTIASFVTGLTLVILLENNTERYYKFPTKALQFQKLKCLTLRCEYSSNSGNDFEDGNCNLLRFLRGIVENAKVLNQIKISIGPGWRTLTTPIQMVKKCGIQSKRNLFTYLKIEPNVTNGEWVNLGNIGLKLQRLSITLDEGHHDTLKGFLQSQADTLSVLKIIHEQQYIFSDDDVNTCTISFPSMPRLKSLEIDSIIHVSDDSNFVDWSMRIFDIPNFSYTKQFPALKQLNLKEINVIWPCFLRDNVLPLNTLEELMLPEFCYNENSIIKAALLFPNIKKLHVTAEEKMLNAVYERMKNLEDLTLYTTPVTSIDNIISGVDHSEFVNVVGPRVAKIKAWKKLLKSSTKKSMKCLENLQILRLKAEGPLYEGRMLEFTYISGLVLREMKSLKCLDLGVRRLSNLENEFNLLDELRETLSVLIKDKYAKVHRRQSYKMTSRRVYVPAESDGLEFSDDSDSN